MPGAFPALAMRRIASSMIGITLSCVRSPR
jgi:hypothetical protein